MGNASTVLSLRRYQVYEAWRAAAHVVQSMRAVRRGQRAEPEARDAFLQLAKQLPEVAQHLPPEAREAATDLAQLICGESLLDDLLRAAWTVHQMFGRVMLDVGTTYSYAAESVSLSVEESLLAAAYRMGSHLYLNGKIDVPALAEEAGVEVAVTRRVVCYWLDEGLVYLPGDLQEPDEDEHFVLAEAADERRDNWPAYAARRVAERRVKITIEYRDQLPHDCEKTVEGAAMDSGIECEADRCRRSPGGLDPR